MTTQENRDLLTHAVTEQARAVADHQETAEAQMYPAEKVRGVGVAGLLARCEMARDFHVRLLNVLDLLVSAVNEPEDWDDASLKSLGEQAMRKTENILKGLDRAVGYAHFREARRAVQSARRYLRALVSSADDGAGRDRETVLQACSDWVRFGASELRRVEEDTRATAVGMALDAASKADEAAQGLAFLAEQYAEARDVAARLARGAHGLVTNARTATISEALDAAESACIMAADAQNLDDSIVS